jgi:hypothetical protein
MQCKNWVFIPKKLHFSPKNWSSNYSNYLSQTKPVLAYIYIMVFIVCSNYRDTSNARLSFTVT